jgi:ATP-binding cassette, subfamily B, bacterial
MPVITCILVGWRYARGIKRRIIMYVALSTLARSLTLAYPLIVGWIVRIIETNASLDSKVRDLAFAAGVYWITSAAFWLFHRPARISEIRIAGILCTRYQRHLLRCCYELPLSWHQSHHSGEIIERVNKGVTSIREFWSNSYISIQEGTRFVLSLGILLFWLSPMSAIITGTGYFLGIFVIQHYESQIRERLNLYLKNLRSLASLTQDYLANIVTVISLRLGRRCSREVHSRSTPVISAIHSFAKVSERKWQLIDLVVDAGIGVSLFRSTNISEHELSHPDVYVPPRCSRNATNLCLPPW